MIQTTTYQDLGGGINAGAAPAAIGLREWTDARNFYPHETVARRRGGIRRLTVVTSWDDDILGFRRLKRSDGTQFFVTGGVTKFGRLVDENRMESLIMRDALGVNPDPDRWDFHQYKEFVYGMRKGTNGLWRIDGNTAAKAGLIAPTVAHVLADKGGGSSGALPAGSYKAVYTWGNLASGYESNPSPESNVVTLLGTTSLNHTTIPRPTDPFLDVITIYRSLVNQDNGVFYKVTSFSPFVDPSIGFEDYTAISLLGAQASYRNGVPPTDFRFGDIWNERLWASNGRDVRFSETLLLEAFGDENEINLTPDDGFSVTGIKNFDDRIIIGKSGAIYYVTGTDRQNFDTHLLSDKHGVKSHYSMKTVENKLYFYGTGKAVYVSDGTSVKQISDPKVKPYLDAIADEDEEFLTAAVFEELGWYVLALPPGDQIELSSPHTYLVYDYRRQVWTVFSHDLGGDFVRVLDDTFSSADEPQMRLGTTGGDVFHFADPTYDYDDRFVSQTYDCPGSVTGIIVDGAGAATGHLGSFGFALLCNDASAASLGPLQSDVNGVWLFPSVPAGTYTLTIYDAIDQAYRTVVGGIVVVDNTLTNDGSRTLNTLGSHPVCT